MNCLTNQELTATYAVQTLYTTAAMLSIEMFKHGSRVIEARSRVRKHDRLEMSCEPIYLGADSCEMVHNMNRFHVLTFL